jgi:hypothetical protein
MRNPQSEEATMQLTPQRRFVTPEPGEDWNVLAQRVLPDEPTDEVVERLKSWNLHLFVRLPPGQLLGSDVVFIEPPREARSGGG